MPPPPVVQPRETPPIPSVTPPPPIPVPPVPQEKRQEYTAPPAAMNTGTPPPVVAAGPRYVAGDWSYPGTDQMADSYPDRAASDEVEGTVTIDCTVSAAGRVTGCNIISESPKGYGFGAATVKLFVKYAKVKPSSVGGELREGDRKKFTYKWQLG
ncbi:TonB family protein [Asticcacaulis benevestitus]|nr:TonB family protein [Asticcacaulis benevestitus]